MAGPASSGFHRWTALALAIIVALLALAVWGFHYVTGNAYLDWYLSHGSAIALATSLVTVGWGDVNRQPNLISAHPVRYFAALMHTGGLAYIALAGTMGRRRATENPAPTGQLLKLGEVLIAIVVVALLAVTVLLWLVLVMPIQYFIFAVCGAPVRLAMDAAERPIAWTRPDGGVDSDLVLRDRALPAGGWEVGLDQRPVTSTALIASAVLLVLNLWRPGFLAPLLAL